MTMTTNLIDQSSIMNSAEVQALTSAKREINFGGRNVAEAIDQEHPIANMEQVINWNPEVIVMWHSQQIAPETFIEDPQWQSVAAIQNNRVYMLPNAFFCDLWTPKFQYSVKAAAKWLYPDIFSDMILEKKLDDMLKTLYAVEFDI